MKQLEIVFKKNEELHGYECKITQEEILNEIKYHCLENRNNDVYGFYIEVLNGECNRDLQ